MTDVVVSGLLAGYGVAVPVGAIAVLVIGLTRSYQIDRIERSGDGFSVNLTLADPNGGGAPQVFRVTLDRDTWRVCGDPLSSD